VPRRRAGALTCAAIAAALEAVAALGLLGIAEAAYGPAASGLGEGDAVLAGEAVVLVAALAAGALAAAGARRAVLDHRPAAAAAWVLLAFAPLELAAVAAVFAVLALNAVL
jgi:hypothetical protein